MKRRLNLDLADDEMGRLAATFDEMLDRIERAFARQQQFTGDAAHELRTPIGLMRSRVDVVLNQDRTSAHYRDEFQHIRHDLERMTELVTSLLMLARTDSSELPLERHAFDLKTTAENVIALSQERARDCGIEIQSRLQSVTVNADEHLLIQVLLNLMDNAIRNTPPGGRIILTCHSDADQVVLEMADSGRGIPAGDRDRVFERFYRVDAGRDRESGGVGLGLSLCKVIVEAHGGTIGVVDTGVQGTTIRVTLPNLAP